MGQILLGKYRVDSILGHGGMGVVASCIHLALNERVAIKMLRQDVLGDQDAVSRFVREAQSAAKLKSEYVARVSDVGTFESGVPYMVMEFLDGHDLGKLLEQNGVLPVAWATDLVLQTAEALAEAHSLGIVHRDVKPTNLFVSWRPDGSSLIKVLDFGISKSPMGTDMQLTQTQSLLGTPAYMSPEQMRSARLVDSRTDIWSLGTVLYEILEGRRPFEAESFSEMCVKVAVDPPAPMVNTPLQLQQVILHCLAKAPEQRYASMAELGRDLVPFSQDPHGAATIVERMARMLRRGLDWEGSGTGSGSGSGIHRPALPRSSHELGARIVTPLPWRAGTDPSAVAFVTRPGSDLQTDDHGPQTLAGKHRRRWPLVIGALGLVTAVGVTVGFVASQRDEATATAPAPAAESKPLPPPEQAAPLAIPSAPSQPAPVATPPADPVKEAGDIKPPPPPIDAKPNEAKHRPVVHVGGAKPVVKTNTPVVKKTDDKPVGETTAVPTKDPAKPKEPCDAFASLHGCK